MVPTSVVQVASAFSKFFNDAWNPYAFKDAFKGFLITTNNALSHVSDTRNVIMTT